MDSKILKDFEWLKQNFYTACNDLTDKTPDSISALYASVSDVVKEMGYKGNLAEEYIAGLA